MIAPINTVNSRQNSYVYNNSFRGKNLSKAATTNTVSTKFAKNAMVNVKMSVFAPIFAGIAALFGKELIYDENTGKLSEINTRKNGVLTQSKLFYPNGKKVKEIDEYENDKIKKISYYKPDGKTRDWTIDYENRQDVVTYYYSDGKSYKTIQIELNDGSGKMQIKHFNTTGRWIKTENFVNDMLTEAEMFFDDFIVTKKYENNKLTTEITEFKKSTIKYNIKDYNKQGKLIKATAYKLNSDNELYTSSVTEYPGKNIMRTTHFDENGNVRYIENKNLRTGKTERQYNTK